ncbi:MAG: tryptophan synthase subunit alpha [Clostridiales bacterium]|nr:tryptophan synthase subunit alpha [Clostridiales bacterium]
MNRIESVLAALQEKNEKAFITYVTAGFPDYDKTEELIRAQESAGTDIIELGIPFSDPVADGPVIQAASFEAIKNGATLEKTFECMEKMRGSGVNIPIVFMLYYNTIVHYGVKNFMDRCKACGVDGLIVPDLPLEEQQEAQDALGNCDETIMIQLVAPVSADRIPKIVGSARGFIYCVSSMGVTGQEGQFHSKVIDYLSQVKAASKIPVMMGFGIRTAADIAPMKDVIDGAIVGTHFIQLLRDNGFSADAAAEYCRTFKKEMNEL